MSKEYIYLVKNDQSIWPSSQRILLGEKAVFQCNLNDEVRWYFFRSGPIQFKTILESNDKYTKLIIEKTALYHYGKYCCSGRNFMDDTVYIGCANLILNGKKLENSFLY